MNTLLLPFKAWPLVALSAAPANFPACNVAVTVDMPAGRGGEEGSGEALGVRCLWGAGGGASGVGGGWVPLPPHHRPPPSSRLMP